ncbi:PQQ-binding-like beta-propeller repeat protein [candidate division KSB1 bacterium]|nr:PQQ-binding-like beta-propeller repeat protein [candidate division KSB1 bacterium]
MNTKSNSAKAKAISLLVILALISCSSHKPKSYQRSEITHPLKPAIQIRLPWRDEFKDGKLTGWEIDNQMETDVATWICENGLLVQASDIGSQSDPNEKISGTQIVAGDVNWKDYSVQSRVLNRGSGVFGVLFRYKDSSNYYRWMMGKHGYLDGAGWQLEKCVAGKTVILAKKADFNFPEPNATFNLGVDVCGDTLSGYLDAKRIFQFQDSSFRCGKTGFFCWKNREFCVDGILVNDNSGADQPEWDDKAPIAIRTDHECGTYSFAIRGIVFEDQNGNQRQDPTERGLPNIAVSDGRDVVLTDAHGIYSLENDEADAQFVFACIPGTYEKNLNFYYLPHDSVGQKLFNFGLKPLSENVDQAFTFIHSGGIYFESAADTIDLKSSMLEALAQHPTPQFFITGGDLVVDGRVAKQRKTIARILNKFQVPVYSVCGKNDLCDGLNRLRHFQRYSGPDYFSFDVGDCHFVNYNNCLPSKKQEEWLEKDLMVCAPHMRTVIFQYLPPTKTQLGILSAFNVQAIFSGYRQSNDVVKVSGMMLYTTPPLRFAGADASPAGFRVITIEPDSIYSEFRYGGIEKSTTLVYPSTESYAIGDSLNIVANLYDTKNEIVDVACQLIKEPNINEIGRLNRASKWSWVSRIHSNMTAGDYKLTLSGKFKDSRKWQMVSDFSIRSDKLLSFVPIDNWSMFKKDILHSGLSQSNLKLPLNIKWVKSTGGMVDIGSPVFHHHKLFIAAKDPHNLGNNYICAFNAADGELIWCFEMPTAVQHTVACYEDKIIAQEVSGHLVALDEDSGEIIWQVSLSEDETLPWLCSAPIVVDGICYAGNAAGISAIILENGNVLWKKQLVKQLNTCYASPAFQNGKLIIGAIGDRRNLFALNAMNGNLLWDYKFSGTHSAALIASEYLYIQSIDGELIAIRMETGSAIWHTKLGTGLTYSSPTAIDSLVIAGNGDGGITAINRFNGEQVWKFACSNSLVRFSRQLSISPTLTGSPVVSGQVVFCGGTDGYVYALNWRDGTLLWKLNLGAPILSTPAISGNGLFISAFDGNIYALVADKEHAHK